MLIVGTAVIGLRYGWIAATISETDVITRYAHKYLSDHGSGAQLTDCVAVPEDALSDIWLVVRCRPKDVNESYDYHINRLGGLEYEARPRPATLREPQT